MAEGCATSPDSIAPTVRLTLWMAVLDAHRFAVFQSRHGGGDELLIQRAIQVVVLLLAVA